MKRAAAVNVSSALPALISPFTSYFKSLVSLDNKKELIESAGGSVGFLIQLFAMPLLEGHFERSKKRKLKDFGFNTYCLAAFKQANKSLDDIKSLLPNDIPIQEVLLGREKEFIREIDKLEKNLSLMVFRPKYHPAIQLVKKVVIRMLCYVLDGVMNEVQVIHLTNSFKKHYNSNIDETVKEEFGDEYESHLKQNEKYWFEEKEIKLLIKTINDSKIGFVDNEDLKYEDAYGSWLPISSKGSFGEWNIIEEIENVEQGLKKVEHLIEEYFAVEPDNHVEKILFVIADFGKGKSVFLRRYAAQIAKKYIETGDGPIPIYLNLRSFANYSSDTRLGVIEDFLLTEHGINIDSEYFRSKEYVFLLDSLDESCDLSKADVEKVISSIKRVQNIDKARFRCNRLIVTSRPFDDVLFNQIVHHKPHLLKNERNAKEVAHVLSLYGFKREQFNDWVNNTLKTYAAKVDFECTTGYAAEIFNALRDNSTPDIYSILFSKRTLSSGELRRPIFGYMIYQLLINNINITQVGKIGIYLSFLNLLTKEAKYINDPNLKISLQEQFEARNILHHIGALWLYEKQKGKQGSLKKADICRIIGGYNSILSDSEVLDKYKQQGHSDIRFLSHSYFGENNSVLHFQHQSFAEVLIAEYYLKVLIKSALDRPIDLEKVITKLNIGQPTHQCILFFKELMSLLRESVGSEGKPEMIEKRKLLTPLLSSIAIDVNNKTLNSQQLYFDWYRKGKISNETEEIPSILLSEWCIDQGVIDNIIQLCEQIIATEKPFFLSKSTTTTSLIENEVTQLLDSNYKQTENIEKYLALVAGNILFNTTNDFFIRKINGMLALSLMTELRYGWLNDCFRGLHLEFDNVHRYALGEIVSHLSLIHFDLRNSNWKNVTIYNSEFISNLFSDSTFENVMFEDCAFGYNDFQGVQIKGVFDVSNVKFRNIGKIPNQIVFKVNRRAWTQFEKHESIPFTRFGTYGVANSSFIEIARFSSLHGIEQFFATTSFYFKYCLNNNLITKDELKKIFSSRKKAFREKIDEAIDTIVETGEYGNKEVIIDDITELPF